MVSKAVISHHEITTVIFEGRSVDDGVLETKPTKSLLIFRQATELKCANVHDFGEHGSGAGRIGAKRAHSQTRDRNPFVPYFPAICVDDENSIILGQRRFFGPVILRASKWDSDKALLALLLMLSR